MTYEQRVEHTNELFGFCQDLCARKNADYSPGADTLHNFKHGAAIARLSPFQFLIALVSKQFGAICTAVETAPAYPGTNTEHLFDKIVDVINYMVLLKCLLVDLAPEPGESDPLTSEEEAALDEWLDWLPQASLANFMDAIAEFAAPAEQCAVPVKATPLADFRRRRKEVGDKAHVLDIAPKVAERDNRALYRRMHDGSLCEFVGTGQVHGTFAFLDLEDGEKFTRSMLDLADLEPVIVEPRKWETA